MLAELFQPNPQEALKLAVGSLEAVVENALKDGKAGALQPARPHKRSSRRVPTFPELENNIFERNRRASRAGSKEEVSPGPSAPGPSGSSQTSKALPAPATAPKFKFQRRPVGFFNAPGAGQPAEAISERWRRRDPKRLKRVAIISKPLFGDVPCAGESLIQMMVATVATRARGEGRGLSRAEDKESPTRT